MGLCNQRLIVRHGAEVIFDLVEVDSAVAVVVGSDVGLVVDRSEPERGYTKIFQVAKMIGNALEVATVVGLWRVAIIGSRCCARRHVVGRIAIGEAVGHDEVNDVISRDALKSALLWFTRLQDQVCFGITRRCVDRQLRDPGLCSLRNLQPDEDVLPIRLRLDLLHSNAGIVDGDLRIREPLAVEQHHYRGDVICPPIGRLDLGYLWLGDAETTNKCKSGESCEEPKLERVSDSYHERNLQKGVGTDPTPHLVKLPGARRRTSPRTGSGVRCPDECSATCRSWDR